MEFFEFFYRWKTFYGPALFDHLKGWDDALMDYNPDYNVFPSLFLWTFGIAATVFVLYYYLINSPRLSRWWHWLITMLIVAAVSYWLGFRTVITDLVQQTISSSLATYIGRNNAMMFGIYNMGLAVLWYFVLTLCFRRWSRNCKHSPWVLLSTKINNRKK